MSVEEHDAQRKMAEIVRLRRIRAANYCLFAFWLIDIALLATYLLTDSYGY